MLRLSWGCLGLWFSFLLLLVSVAIPPVRLGEVLLLVACLVRSDMRKIGGLSVLSSLKRLRLRICVWEVWTLFS